MTNRIRTAVRVAAILAVTAFAVATPASAQAAVAVSVWVGDPLHEQGEPHENDPEATTMLCHQLWQ